jgi:hypothetical protein
MNKVMISYLRRFYSSRFGKKCRLSDKQIWYCAKLFFGCGNSIVWNVTAMMKKCDETLWFKMESAMLRDVGFTRKSFEWENV